MVGGGGGEKTKVRKRLTKKVAKAGKDNLEQSSLCFDPVAGRRKPTAVAEKTTAERVAEGEDRLDEKENGGESPARKPKKQPTTKTYVKRNVRSKLATSGQSSVRGSPMPKKVKKQVFFFAGFCFTVGWLE